MITGCHAILVEEITDQHRKELIDIMGRIFATDDKYRLIAHVDERTVPYEKEGLCRIWHLALDNNDYYMNYGIYANGLLVESTSKRFLDEYKVMET